MHPPAAPAPREKVSRPATAQTATWRSASIFDMLVSTSAIRTSTKCTSLLQGDGAQEDGAQEDGAHIMAGRRGGHAKHRVSYVIILRKGEQTAVSGPQFLLLSAAVRWSLQREEGPDTVPREGS